MINKARKKSKNRTSTQEKAPKKATKSLAVHVTTDYLNKCLTLCSINTLVNYPRWVQDNPQNRLVVKNYLINDVLYRKRGTSLMRYLPCCNIFYLQKNKKVEDHQNRIKARDLLLNDKEKKLIAKFFKEERKKGPNLEYIDFRNQLIPDLVELIQSLQLQKIGIFIDSLPSKDGCFEFPLIRCYAALSCAEKQLNQRSRVGIVKKRHNLVLEASKNKKTKIPISPQILDQGELSPNASKIRSLYISSGKKLKRDGVSRRASKSSHLPGFGRGVKRDFDPSNSKKHSKSSSQKDLVEGFCQDSCKSEDVKSRDQRVKPFEFTTPIKTEEPEDFFMPPKNESPEFRFCKKSLQVRADLDVTQGEEYDSHLLGETPTEILELTFQYDSECENEEVEDKLSGFNSETKAQSYDRNRTKLGELRRVLDIKKKEGAKALNRVLEIEEQAAEAETKAIKAEKGIIKAKGDSDDQSGSKAIEAEKARVEAESHLKEVLKQSSTLIEKVEKLSKEVDDLESEIKGVMREMEIENLNSEY